MGGPLRFLCPFHHEMCCVWVILYAMSCRCHEAPPSWPVNWIPRNRPGVGPEDLELDLFLTLVLLSSYNLTSLDQVHEPTKVENRGHRFSNTYATFPLPLSYFNPGKDFIDKDFLPSKRQS